MTIGYDDPGLQAAKAVVEARNDALAAAWDDPGAVADALAPHAAPGWHWRGVHPFGDRHGAQAVAQAFWTPLATAFARLQRRADITLAGPNEADGHASIWTLSMGHLMGLFDRPWLGIRPTGRIAMLRYAEFDRVQDGRVVESAMFCDIPHVMIQAGQDPFPPQTGAHLVQPGPATHDGLLRDAQDPDEGAATMGLILRMLRGPNRGYHDPDEAAHLARVWHADMAWWGPAGIGSAFTIPGYMKHHTRPYDDAFAQGGEGGPPDLCHVAEGSYGAIFGWPNMTVRSGGGFMGMTASAGPTHLRVCDVYRRAGDKLAENWVFIDLLDWLAQQGHDALARNAEAWRS
ncbi:MAG: nuclear transport factor 2 family protein [Paracoccaceae bacterium]